MELNALLAGEIRSGDGQRQRDCTASSVPSVISKQDFPLDTQAHVTEPKSAIVSGSFAMQRAVAGVAVGAQGPDKSAMAAADRQLLAATVSGDTRAYRQLVATHLGVVVATGRRLLNDAMEADDVAQETFLRLWRNAAQVEVGPYGLRPWLKRVATNLAIDRLRQRKPIEPVAELPEVPVAATQERVLVARDATGRLEQALAGLPDRQRQALVLFHFEGLSQIEVGAALGVSDEAVESLLARARRGLKTALKDEWQALLASMVEDRDA